MVFATAAEAVADSSKLEYMKATALNATSFFAASPKDLLYLVPRMAARAGAFVTDDIPGALENIFGGPIAGRVMEEATAGQGRGMASSAYATAANFLGAAAPAEPIATDAGFFTFFQSFGLHQIRTFGGIFTYLTSKWALGCFAVSVVLKRTAIYASTRRSLQLNWQVRALVRIVPILVLLSLCQSLMRSIRCQLSPDFPLMRYGELGKHTRLDFSGEGGPLYRFTSLALFYESELESCVAVEMVSTEAKPIEYPSGSLSMLWPSFQAFSLAQFVETVFCSLQNALPATETGMTLFEHSLAFAEAEAMVSNQLGLGSFTKPASTKPTTGGSAKIGKLVTKSFLVSRFNVPPEVLLIALISCLNNLSSQILGVFGKQAKYRLINTGIWGVAFMTAFTSGFLNTSIDQGLESGIFRFPTVCVVGFIPHTLILIGIFLCANIYALALLITMLSPPDSFPREMTLKERFWRAQENMQANIPLSALKLDMREDFYTSLLRTGITALTAASEAVFLNEGQRIKVGRWTWLEEEEMQDMTKNNQKSKQSGSSASPSTPSVEQRQGIDPSQLRGGYARERNTEAIKLKNQRSVRADHGVGAHQRGARYVLAFNFFSGIFWLLSGWFALFVIRVLAMIGIQYRPRWLSYLLNDRPAVEEKGRKTPPSENPDLEFWLLADNGELSLPKDNDVDVATETKKRLQVGERSWGPPQEDQLDSKLYSWFINGGWWGERDESGEFRDDDLFDDVTSVISVSSAASESGAESIASGRTTPTQGDFWPQSTRESTPDHDPIFNASHLARLLNPQDSEARDEARMLAAHLSSEKPMTRLQYRGSNTTTNKRVLTSTRYRPPGFTPANPTGRLTAEEEAEVLGYLIVKFRDQARQDSSSSRADEWASGGDGMGAGGPQCVVCQSSPRTVLAWPCRCLSLCDECRISLAMNNFGSCVCCRQEVLAFSRLYVP